MSRYQMLLDAHYQRCAFGLMTPQSVLMVHLLYLSRCGETVNLFPLLLTLSTAPVKFTQDFADKKEQTLTLQENLKAFILWEKSNKL